MDLALAARLTTIIVMVAVFVAAAELVAVPAPFRSNGFYSWDVLRTGHRWALTARRGRVASSVLGQPGLTWIFTVQASSAVLAIAGIGPAALWIGLALACLLVLHVRNSYGLDGSDQMQVVVLAALLLYHLAGDDTGRRIALGFIAAQALLSYVAAGIAKLVSPMWRDGSAITGVLDTKSYGNRLGTRVLRRVPRLAPVICWATLVFECALPFLVLFGPGPALVFIAAGIAFHLGVASAMGLNLFLWSFAATYPCLYLLATWLH